MEVINPGWTQKDIDEQIEKFRLKKYVVFDYLTMFQKIFKAQYNIEKELTINNIYPSISYEDINSRIKKGLPVLEANNIHFDEKLLTSLLKDISNILSDYPFSEDFFVNNLTESLIFHSLILYEMILNMLYNNQKYFKDLSERLGVKSSMILFFGKALSAPFLRCCAKTLIKHINLESMKINRCPVCGGIPMMARLLKGDGKRLLECSLCNSQWVFARLMCPFCLNEDQNTLSFIFIEEDSEHRLDTCDQCKMSIKTLDERKQEEKGLDTLIVEDIATIYLEILAVKKAYLSLKDPL
ncbi:MAG: formate dehydrogenase accessory protein FdhE [Desulfobacterales bacterium]|nr:formate dehydrogenase accessory protein FdhE [Desulfobacterales bacterium]